MGTKGPRIPLRHQDLSGASHGFRGRWVEIGAAAVVLAGFYALLITSVAGKSVTCDETVGLAGGYSYWRFNDYRLNPEGGMLAQRLAGLALGTDLRFPPPDDPAWQRSQAYAVGDVFLHRLGNSAESMLLRSRMAMGLLGVAFGVAVYAWSRRLFGPGGAMISLLLCAFSPIVLANGGLVTSDLCVAVFFLAALGALWAVLHDVRPATLAASVLATAGLFLSKTQAPLFLPVAVVLVAIRVLAGPPLVLHVGKAREIAHRGRQTAIFALIAVGHAAVAAAVIWAFYGFRYTMLNGPSAHDRPPIPWEVLLDSPVPFSRLDELHMTDSQKAAFQKIMAPAERRAEALASPPVRAEVLDQAFRQVQEEVFTDDQRGKVHGIQSRWGPRCAAAFLNFLRDRQWLPEAYLYAHAHTFHYSRSRTAFLNGQVRDEGWWAFFLYTFLVKTPLPFFAVGVLAAGGAGAAWIRARRNGAIPLSVSVRKAVYATAPLWLFVAGYWALLLTSSLNIGHRHLLPAYGPLFILSGAAVHWFRTGATPRSPAGRQAAAVPAARASLKALPQWARSHPTATVLVAALVLLVAEMAAVWPDYLAYFNPIVGMKEGYRHLVDSSLDWGQDLPALKRFVDGQRAGDPGRAVYLSYFGTGSPEYEGIQAVLLPGWPGYDYRRNAAGPARPLEALRLTGGLYCISATMLQPILYDRCSGPWSEGYEKEYQSMMPLIRQIQHGDAEAIRQAGLALDAANPAAVAARCEDLRLARLCAFLRRREPTTNVHYSILVYDLSDKDIAEALEGPNPGR